MDVTSSIRDLNELNPKVKALAESLIAECKRQGLNIGISETYRSPERQDYLYAQGRTRPGSIITKVKGSSMSSYHQWRLAFDVFNNVRGEEYNPTVINKVGAIGKTLGLEWGGSWSGFRDTPHFQYTFGLSIEDLKNGKKPPVGAALTKPVIPPTVTQPVGSAPVVATDEVYSSAIKSLVAKGIISSEESWLPNPNIKYVEVLAIKLALKAVEKITYEEAINMLSQKEIIGESSKWLNRTYSIEDVKWLIKKYEKSI